MDFFDNYTQCVAYLEGAGYSKIAERYDKELWYSENQMFRYAEVQKFRENYICVKYFHKLFWGDISSLNENGR